MITLLTNQEKWSIAFDILKEDIPLAIWETLYSSIISTFFAILLGLPLGILLVVGEKGGLIHLPKPIMLILNWIINAFRSIPFLLLMILVLPLSELIFDTRVGTIATIIPLIIAATPFIARLVETSIKEVDKGLIEASLSMGAKPIQVIVNVLIPEALPSLILNFTIALTTVISYTSMSGAIGGGGLGKIAHNYGYLRYNTPVMIVAIVVIVIIVIIIQSLGSLISKLIDHKKH